MRRATPQEFIELIGRMKTSSENPNIDSEDDSRTLDELIVSARQIQVSFGEERGGGQEKTAETLPKSTEALESAPSPLEPAPGSDEDEARDVDERSTGAIVRMILETLDDVDMTTDDIIDLCRVYTGILEKRFPIEDAMIQTLMVELEKIKDDQTIDGDA